MPDRAIYEYTVIRIVPSVERGEFLNVGVILYCKDKKFLGIKYSIDENRLAAFSNQVDVGLIADYLHAWKLVCEGDPEGGEIGKLEMASRFRWLTASRSTIIQSSKTHPGLCCDPKETLEEIFERYVT